MTLTPPPEPADCFCCHRAATGIGIGDRFNPKWLCVECALLAKDIREVKKFSVYEDRAVDEAGADAGNYLDSIGITDLSALSQNQWRAFIKKMIFGFGASLRRQVREGRAPF